MLSIIGDGPDDQQAAVRRGISPPTVYTHPKAIMAKRKPHHKGQLVLYAVQHGRIWVTGLNVYHPGFRRCPKALDDLKTGDRAKRSDF